MKKYTEDFQIKMVSLYHSGWKISEICKTYHVPETTLRNWIVRAAAKIRSSQDLESITIKVCFH